MDLEKAIEMEESKAKQDPAYRPMLFGALKSCAEAKFSVNDFQGSLDDTAKLISLFPSHPLSCALSAIAKEKIGDTDGYSKDMSDFKHLDEQHVKKYGCHLKNEKSIEQRQFEVKHKGGIKTFTKLNCRLP